MLATYLNKHIYKQICVPVSAVVNSQMIDMLCKIDYRP